MLSDIDNPTLSDFGHDPGWVIALKAVLIFLVPVR